MSAGTVIRERRGHVFVMGLDRAAKRNAFDLPMWDALCDAYAELESDPELRVGVLHASGAHFTGGLDLPQWGATFSSGRWEIKDGALDPLGLHGRRVSKPVVVARGHSARRGGGRRAPGLRAFMERRPGTFTGR